MHVLQVRKRRFDAGKLAVRVWGQAERVRGGLPDHWRSFATQVVTGHTRVPAEVTLEAAMAQQVAVGSNYFADLADNNVCNVRPGSHFEGMAWESARCALTQAFDTGIAPAAVNSGDTKPFPYTWLACNEVEHHVDEGIGENDAFLVWHVAGPSKSVVFSSLGLAVAMDVGDVLIFDGMTTHSVRHRGKEGKDFPRLGHSRDLDEDPAKVTVYLSVDVPYDEALYDQLGIKHRSCDESQMRQSYGFAVNRFNGVTKVLAKS